MKPTVHRLLIVITALALLAGCRTAEQKAATQPALISANASKLFADYHEERLKLYPMEATLAGDHRYDDQLPNNLTTSFRASEGVFYRKYLAALGRLHRNQLSLEDQLSYDILQWECERQL